MATVPTPEAPNQAPKFKRRRFSRRSRDEKVGFEYEWLSIGREAEESEEKWNNCEKNSGHFSFIPADNFGLQHLPESEQNGSVLEYIHAVSALTVRLRVNHTSPRPPREGVASRRYDTPPSSSRTGTGCVIGIQLRNEPCRCSSCRFADQPSPTCWLLDVMTACHVVYDTEEAKFTRVDLPREDGSWMTLAGSHVMDADELGDWCHFCCVTHDQSVAEKIENHLQNMESASQKLSALGASVSDTIVIVSYPHGQPKKITVGKLKNTRFHSYPQFQEYIGDRDIPTSKLEVIHGFWWRTWMEHTFIGYDSDTCAGSSGAPVILLNGPASSRKTNDTRFLPVHCKGKGPFGWNTGCASLQSVHGLWLQIVSHKGVDVPAETTPSQ